MLSNDEYVKILEFYKMKVPDSKKQLKLEAEKILAEKLCRCIKKVDPINEARSIGICTRSIFNKRGFTRGRFKCKGRRSVTFRKKRNGTRNKQRK
jgi:hypothetical protein